MNQFKVTFQQHKKDNLMYWFERIRVHQVTANNGAAATWIYFNTADEVSADWQQKFKKDTLYIQ